MEISLDFGKAWKAGLGFVAALALLLIGRAASPAVADGPVVLTPDRWQAAALARKAGAEVVRLAADAQSLHDLAARETPDAIRAMLLAQQIYAGHRQGTTATTPARQALIAAAEYLVARFGANRSSLVEVRRGLVPGASVPFPKPTKEGVLSHGSAESLQVVL